MKLIRDFTFGYSALTSTNEINLYVTKNQQKRKTLQKTGSTDGGCSYE